MRIRGYKSHRAIELIQKLKTLAGTFILKPEIGFMDLLASNCEEPDLH